MRFLHTADWHIGKTLRGRIRMDEFAAALDQVAGIAADGQVDAVLAGRRRLRLAGAAARGREARLRLPGPAAAGAHRLRRSSPATTTTPASWPRCAACSKGLQHPRPRRGAPARPGRRGRGCRAATARRRRGSPCCPSCPSARSSTPAQVMGPEHALVRGLRPAASSRSCAPHRRTSPPRTVNLVLAHLLVAGARVGHRRAPAPPGRDLRRQRRSSCPPTCSTSPSATCTGRRSSWRPPRRTTPAR